MCQGEGLLLSEILQPSQGSPGQASKSNLDTVILASESHGYPTIPTSGRHIRAHMIRVGCWGP
jgi:hypothetical protein